MIDTFEPYNLEQHGVRLPQIDIPEKDKIDLGLSSNSTNFDYLWALCDKGFEKKIKNGKIDPKRAKEYADRRKVEMETFQKLNLVDYVLLVHDVLSWCDTKNIPRGPGRGSASGSIVLFLIGCTQVDSVKHNLSFTRFVSEARAQSKTVNGIIYLSGRTLMDVDSDLSYYRRNEVINHIEEKYKGKTSKIGTQASLTGKILIKEVSKAVLEYNEEDAKRLADLIEKHFGIVESLDETYKNIPEFKKWVDASQTNKECFLIASSLSDLIRNRGQHPSGIALSYGQINDILPLELSSSKDVISSYNMGEVANLVVKLDILGLKTVDVIDETCKLLGINSTDIDINHESIYKFLAENNNFYGLFQIEEGLSKKVILDVKPKNISHLSACIAISRPGALAYIKDYGDFVNNGNVKPFFPVFDETLKDTGNIILYQEQITKICEKVYKLDPISSDQVRYGVGKKKRDEIQKWESVVKSHGKNENIPDDVTQKFWDTINKSADYLFCECLSPDTVVETKDGDKLLHEINTGDTVKAFDVKKKTDHFVKVTNKYKNKKEIYEITLEDDRTVKCSMDHKFLCEDYKMHKISEIIEKKLKIITD